MFLQKYSKLLFECDFAMVDFLIGNVRYDRFIRGFTHRKSTIAALPTEMGMAFGFRDPSQAGFEVLY
jgi:hypothetical protein